ncbi:lactate dehydrogenase [Parapedobacter lycopersici]|uniref:lactate dehydrogenase n=1 Tax=Parapedobacter lycopersici TaxID=1864939 RepID=UPI00214DC6D7|nr:lactate dehydrogenase [Parapedobacter lycopersici]
MKAIAYNIKLQEKEALARANAKKHDLTLISNELNASTVVYAQGKNVVIVSTYDILDQEMLWQLKSMGVNKIITRSNITTHIDLKTATAMAFKVANIPREDMLAIKGIAEQVIRHLNLWESGKCVGAACCCQKVCALKPTKETEQTDTQVTANRTVR